MDLRKNYEKKAELKNGSAYLKENVVQTWENYRYRWGKKNVRETFTFSSPKRAKEIFEDFC